jgi:TPP-dependent 2-oxoacid decarboxylase
VGDGSFQLTAQEVSTMLRHDDKPVIFLINNGGYTIERCWLGKTSRFNDVLTHSWASKHFLRCAAACAIAARLASSVPAIVKKPCAMPG